MGTVPALPSSYRHFSLLDTIGKLFENTLLSRILHEISENGLMREDNIGFWPSNSPSLKLACLFEILISVVAGGDWPL